MRRKKVTSFFLLVLLALLVCIPPLRASGPGELIAAVPFGPSVGVPDPARGYNGWYTSEAGVTETLLGLDFSMRLEPRLAESWENIDPLRWRIILKKEIRFHDGAPLDAGAVKRSFTRIIDERSGVFNKRLQELLDIESIAVGDDRTLIFETRRPNAAFPYYLTSPGTGIVGPGSEGGRIHGTGPFRLGKVIPDEETAVTAFGGYWGGKPRLARARLKIIRNPLTRMLAFEAGQVDLAVGFPENDVERLRTRKDVKILHGLTTRLCFFFVRVGDGPLADPRIRRALNYAIDRREIVNTVLAGIGGEPAGAVFPPILPWSNVNLEPYPYDPDRALKLLAEAGAADGDGDGVLEIDGRPLVLNMWTYEGRASLKPTLELIQDQLRRVGIASRIKITKKGSPINQAMKRGEVHLNLQMWNVAPQGDPHYFISNVFTAGAVSNFTGYRNPELDALTRKGKTTFDTEKRKKIYDCIQEIIFEESPVIVLFYKSMVTAARTGVKNYRIHPAENRLLTHLLYMEKPGDGK